MAIIAPLKHGRKCHDARMSLKIDQPVWNRRQS